MGHVARKAKVVWPLAMWGNVGTSLSKKATKPLAIFATPDSHISHHPRRLPIRSISAEGLVNLRERHKWKHRRKRCDANQRIATDDKSGFGKLEKVNLLGHGSIIYWNTNVRNGSEADSRKRSKLPR